ncbi:hypothetical protein GCM10011344_06470 [Dokdonia pacifica]|uniref:Uncharacterized protein n=1 Tax=Dokdonia pacifica TaxID=1627892 RepID=A0A238Z3S3_9FLAO|nr:hypothetical protein [Dokdonia pacifica]GGG08622.1 hypothetical protein GCM10011344_06470 [Dokdonia pacifica]SNR77531.1 hypothetical protein SAMN06265376_102557 [Dokdonia pacifica]
METIRLRYTIKKPKAIVQKALLEGIAVHQEFETLTILKRNKISHSYIIHINPLLQYKNLTDVSLVIDVYDAANSKHHTQIRLLLHYTNTTYYTFRKLILKGHLKCELLSHFNRFKSRVEKWS